MPNLAPYQLISYFGLQNSSVTEQPSNPYKGKIPAGAIKDKALYQSILNTPVLSDITFGDLVNQNNNSWTDNDGIVHSFKPVTHATVIITTSQVKKIVETDIQGRDGSIKEYIGMSDYQVTINGIICGPNGVFPKDDVTALKEILVAPIPLVVSAWYLQMLDIHSLVIKSFDIGQAEGAYSMQPFSIQAVSDIPIELKIKG